MTTDSLTDWNASLTDQPGSFIIHHDDPQCTHSRGRRSSEVVLSSASWSLRGNNSNRKRSDICGLISAAVNSAAPLWHQHTAAAATDHDRRDNIQVILTSTLIKHYWTDWSTKRKKTLKFKFHLQEMFFNTHSFTSINLTINLSEDVR